MGMIHHVEVAREQRQIAGKTVAVSVVQRKQTPNRLRIALHAILGLLRGMWLTLTYFGSRKSVVTRQYPENRDTLQLTERFRGNLRFKFPNIDEQQRYTAAKELIATETETAPELVEQWMRNDSPARWYHNCTGCAKCEEACPNASIRILTRHGEILDDREIDRFVWRMDSCMFCNACGQACPWDAIEINGGFENAVYDRRLLVYCLNKIAGPRINLIQDEQDPDVRTRMIEPRDRFSGPIPMNGVALPNLPPIALLADKNEAGAA